MEAQKTADTVPQGNSAEGVDGIFDIIKSLCNKQLVNEVRGVFEFHLTGKEEGVWYIDLQNDAGKQPWRKNVSTKVRTIICDIYEEGTFRANANIEGLAGNVTPYWSSPHICLIMLLFRKRYFSRRKHSTPLVCGSEANFFLIHVRILRSFRRAWFCFNSKKTWNPL